MYGLMLALHSLARWAVLLVGVWAVIRAISGWLGRKPWGPDDDRAGSLFAMSVDLQFLLGLLLYLFFSPITRAAFSDFGLAMRTSALRFWAVEHVATMVLAVALVHIGRVRARRRTESRLASSSDGALSRPGRHRHAACDTVARHAEWQAALPSPLDRQSTAQASMRNAAIVVLMLVASVRSSAQQPPPGVSREVLIDNDVALVARLGFEPGAHEAVHTHPFSAVQIQLTSGAVQMEIGSAKDSSPRKPGDAWFIPKEAPHAAANVGERRCEFITVAMKPHALTPMPAQSQPATPGITRTPRFENDETRAALVSFAPGSREEVHTHPFDLFVIQLTPGKVETVVGSNQSVADTEPGRVLFIRRNAPHAVGNPGSTPFDAMSVAVK